MSYQMLGSDVIGVAVQIEVRGEAFYREAAGAAGDPEAEKLFGYLADEEIRHKQVFEKLSTAIDQTEIDDVTWEETMDYIAASVDSRFFQADAPIEAVPLGETVEDMLVQAIAFEKETLLFFFALRDIVRAPNQPAVDRIIGEEKSHIRRLAAMRSAG